MRPQRSMARCIEARSVRSPSTTSAPSRRKASARSSSRRTKARTLCPLASRNSVRLRPMPPTAPAAPVTRIGLSCSCFVVISLTSGYFKRRTLLAHRTKQDVVSKSDRQPVLLSQALVECGLGDETAQETDPPRHFSCRIAPPRSGSSRCLQDCPGYDFGGITCFHRFPHNSLHAGARRIVDVKQSVGRYEILFK